MLYKSEFGLNILQGQSAIVSETDDEDKSIVEFEKPTESIYAVKSPPIYTDYKLNKSISHISEESQNEL